MHAAGPGLRSLLFSFFCGRALKLYLVLDFKNMHAFQADAFLLWHHDTKAMLKDSTYFLVTLNSDWLKSTYMHAELNAKAYTWAHA
eukprot:1162065-Pelagomonas_calceolata.AAC.9